MKTDIRGCFGAAMGGALLLMLCGCVTTTVAAEERPDVAVAERAARLSYLEGDVRVALEGGSEWVEPRLNLTLTGGDGLRTDRDARAELRWDRGALRLDGSSEVALDRMDDATVRIWLTRGVAALRVRGLDDNEVVAVGTEAGVLAVLRPGDYRVEADDRDGDALIIVRDGLAEFNADGRTYRVHTGEMLRVRRGDSGEPRLSAAFAPDGFDRWCQDREERIERSVGSRYVSADIVGYEDLDGYGDWNYAPGYGYVWFPSNLQPGWTPYAFGSWVWVGPWGWTWVDSSPWGYAPYHYGRWARYHDRWCWVPGPRHERPRYSPAPEGWRRERPVQAGNGHIYRPPPPPREAPPRTPRPRNDNRPRDDRRISIPERPVSPTPRTGEPRTAEPRWPRERPAAGEGDRQNGRDRQGERERQPQPERPLQPREPIGGQRPTQPVPAPEAPAANRPFPAPPQAAPSPAPAAAPAPAPSPPARPAPLPDREPRAIPSPRWAPAPERAPTRPVTPAPQPVRPVTPPVRVMPPPAPQQMPAPVPAPTSPPPPPRQPQQQQQQPAPQSQPAPQQPQQAPPAQHREREPRERDDGPRR